MEGGKFWLTFKYETLPNFCFLCGKMGHDDKHCPEISDWRNAPRQYGDWLRANGKVGEVGACGLIHNHVGIHVDGGGQIIGEQLAVETLKGRWITRLWVWVVILVRTGPQWCQEAERTRLSSLGWGWQRVRED